MVKVPKIWKGVAVFLSNAVAIPLVTTALSPQQRRRTRSSQLTTDETVCNDSEQGYHEIPAESRHYSRQDALKRMAKVVSIVFVPTVVPAHPLPAMTTDPQTGIALPDEGEIAQSIPKDWDGVENPLQDGDDKSLLGRLDSTPDSVFYKDPRFVEHVDNNAVRQMTNYVSNVALRKGDSVLDLCSSWTSHIDSSAIHELKLTRVAGLGMNTEELQSNPSLTDYRIKDLNQDPRLPYSDCSFDVVLCQLSIDYLTRPLDVLREVGRVLRPGGRVHILFSNRLFLSKAVALWTGADDIDHAYTVGCYLHFCDSGFTDISAQDLSTRKGRGRIVGDPLYVVYAEKEA